MTQTLEVGIVGNRDPQRLSHVATEQALAHAARALARPLAVEWVPTPALDGPDVETRLASYHALWCAPGSPYQSAPAAPADRRLLGGNKSPVP